MGAGGSARSAQIKDSTTKRTKLAKILVLLVSLAVSDFSARCARSSGHRPPSVVERGESGFALLYSDRDFDPFVEHLGLVSATA